MNRTRRRVGPRRAALAWPVERLEDRTVPSHFGPWGTPINLGPVVNTPASDQHPAISKDGLSLYITSNRPGRGGDDIWVAHRDSPDNPWGLPVNLGPTINTAANDRVPAFSRDGHWMFFGSTRPRPDGTSAGLDLWVSYRRHAHDDFGWQAPTLVPGVNSSADDDGATLFKDDDGGTTLYFTSNRPRTDGLRYDFDIYVSTWNADGSFSPPALVPELSTPARDTRTAISKDGREIYLTSNRPGSIVGPDGLTSLDIWVATRASTADPWSAPVNPGPAVNSAFADGAPALSFHGETMYFYSNRPNGVGGNDLYVTTRAKRHGHHGGGVAALAMTAAEMPDAPAAAGAGKPADEPGDLSVTAQPPWWSGNLE
jgi:hypothetical protein